MMDKKDKAVGLSIWFDREDWGVITDSLVNWDKACRLRKKQNPQSNSDVTADMCQKIINEINTQVNDLN